jgi:hypothetical protein
MIDLTIDGEANTCPFDLLRGINIALYEQGYGIQFRLTGDEQEKYDFTLVRSLELENDF